MIFRIFFVYHLCTYSYKITSARKTYICSVDNVLKVSCLSRTKQKLDSLFFSYINLKEQYICSARIIIIIANNLPAKTSNE